MQHTVIIFFLLMSTLSFAEDSAKKIDPLKGLSPKASAAPDQVSTLPKVAVPNTKSKSISIEGGQKCAVVQGGQSYSEGQAGYESCLQQMKDNAKTGRDK